MKKDPKVACSECNGEGEISKLMIHPQAIYALAKDPQFQNMEVPVAHMLCRKCRGTGIRARELLNMELKP